MNLRFALRLITIPTLVGLLFTLEIMTDRASAVGVTNSTSLISTQASCDLPLDPDLKSSVLQHRIQGIAIASADFIADENPLLNFTEAESDAAAVLFGCDCPACINTLRQLKSQSLLETVNGEKGHCWTSLQRRVSPQTVQEVLKNLEIRDAE